MINKPIIKPYFHIEILDSTVFLISEQESFALNGQLYTQLTPLLTGQTVDDIIEQLQNTASAAEIYYALMLMEQNGYIVEAQDHISSEIAAFLETLQVNPISAWHRLQTTTVSVQCLGNYSLQDIKTHLESLSLNLRKEGDLTLVVTDDYLRPELADINSKAWQNQQPWLLIKPIGTTLWLGPLFIPGETGCWHCLAQRLRTNRPVETYIQKQNPKASIFPTAKAAFPSTWQTGLNLAVTELIKWIVQGKNPQVTGQIITIDTLSLNTETHTLVQRPQCPCCGNPQQFNQTPSPIHLHNQTKTFTNDGGHRSVSPEATLKKYQHHLSPITGVVHTLQPKKLTDNGVIHSYYAGHNFAMMFDPLYFLRQTVRGKSGGKGKTDSQAKASALCEAIERYCGIFQGDEIRQKGRYQELSDRAIHPNHCMLYSEAQYENRQQINEKSTPSQQVPEPFDPQQELDWTPVWSLTHQQFKYIPTAYCYYGYPREQNPYCWANSNGAAAGNTVEEAILQGFMELVERDGVALWWYNRVQRPGVDLASFDDPYLEEVVEYYRSIHRQMWVIDMTTDLNVPTFTAISRRVDREVEDIVFGFGAHFDPKIALLRAITEMNQVLPAVLSVAADGTTEYSFNDPVALDWWQRATIANQPYLVPDSRVKMKGYGDYSPMVSEDLAEDVRSCVNIAGKQSLEVLVLDQTRPDIGLPVVKVIVPGLRHFWQRLAFGRLYDVPVKLGWLSKPLLESQLNPIPIFL
ncbi:MAG: TOMM precursor leader peptide-binding protein [Coleofasciculus sp.]